MPFGISAGAAALIGAGVSGAAAIGGSLLQGNATKSAANSANSAQLAQQQQERTDLAPWTGTGGTANTATTNLLGLNGPDAATAAMGNFQTSPGYQWQLGQGLRAVDAGAASSGLLRSGATLKAEQTFGSGLADQEFTNYYNRLFDMSKLGETAAAGTGAADITTGTGVAQTDLSAGSGLSSIYGNVASGVGNAFNNYQNQSLYQSRTNALMPGGGSQPVYTDQTSTF